MYKTEQESFWSGGFGDEYIKRNSHQSLLISNTNFFTKVLSRTSRIKSVLEFGSNVGNNLKILKELLPEAELSAIEINGKAVEEMKKIGDINIYHNSILDFTVDYKRDFVFTKGVLIHINPDFLVQVYQKLFDASRKYILIMEYYNPVPIEVDYRGHKGKLFKRDFAGEIIDLFPERLELIDYGFVYHRDNHFPMDDGNWFLLKKR